MNVATYDWPFRHWLLHDLPAILRPSEELPPSDWPGWCRYSSPWEVNKRTCNDEAELPAAYRRALGYLTSKAWVAELSTLTGIAGLIPAPYQHGGGVHILDRGGRLDCHIDFAVHPDATYLERRLSLIVFCTTGQSGELQLWDDAAKDVELTHSPSVGSAVLFENSDVSYHSVAAWESDQPRVTLAAYYCAPARPGVSRKRALFVPQRS